MFKNWGTWLGIENENGQVKRESETTVHGNEANGPEINKPTAVAEGEQTSVVKEDDLPPQLLQKATGFSGEFAVLDKGHGWTLL